MSESEPTQAAGGDGHEGAANDGVEHPGGREGGGESGGGAYPNPKTGKAKGTGDFMGHGGQSDIAYSGSGDGGEGGGNENAPTE